MGKSSLWMLIIYLSLRSMDVLANDRFQYFLTTKEQRLQASKEVIQFTSPARRDVLLRVILTVLASVLLLVPVLILCELQPSSPSEVKLKSSLQTLIGFLFTLIFSASCSTFTRARRLEVFSTIVAYYTILVIFLGNTSTVIVANSQSRRYWRQVILDQCVEATREQEYEP